EFCATCEVRTTAGSDLFDAAPGRWYPPNPRQVGLTIRRSRCPCGKVRLTVCQSRNSRSRKFKELRLRRQRNRHHTESGKPDCHTGKLLADSAKCEENLATDLTDFNPLNPWLKTFSEDDLHPQLRQSAAGALDQPGDMTGAAREDVEPRCIEMGLVEEI